jgi:hypothetical protein
MEPLKSPQWLLLIVAGAVLQTTACHSDQPPQPGSTPTTSSTSPEVKKPKPQPKGKESASGDDHVSAIPSGHETKPSSSLAQPRPTLPRDPRVVSILDTTIPERLARMRSRQAAILSGLPSGTQLAAFTLNQQCMEVFSPDQPVPQSRERLLQILNDRIQPTTTFGTFSHRAWEKMAQFVATSAGPTVIIIESDGDEDDPNPQAQQSTQKAIAQLATLPQLQLVVLIGTNPDQRERIRHELEPLAGRYLIREQEERPADLREPIQTALTTPPQALTTPLQGGIK